jgi:Ca2+-binding RTX toxin-like protein
VFGQESYGVRDFQLSDGQEFTATRYYAAATAAFVVFDGSGFTYIGHGIPSTGAISRIFMVDQTNWSVEITGLNFSASRFNELVYAGADPQLKSEIFAGDDRFQGSAHGDFIRSFAGADTVTGGQGNDFIMDTGGANYLRGDEGNDSISGGGDFDDINGNMGDDTASGGAGGDWVVGGKDNDQLFGQSGDDLVYGNLGNDTCDGGDGNDIVRGGQEGDLVSGGNGDDYVSGDRGDDTVTGGAGADLFHTFGDAGIDRVTDFSRAQGDRVQLDPGTQYTVAQAGADTIITMTGGGQMILVGVSMSSLTEGWIFGA